MTALGFTGTQAGLTEAQRTSLMALFENLAPMFTAFHHGDCVGADAEADLIAAHHAMHIEAHPGTDGKGESPKRNWSPAAVIHGPRPYLRRNRDIVHACSMLIACPGGPERQRGSGTWYTIRYARQVGRSLVIVHPDGSIAYELGKEEE